jgi:hypothetical protein
MWMCLAIQELSTTFHVFYFLFVKHGWVHGLIHISCTTGLVQLMLWISDAGLIHCPPFICDIACRSLILELLSLVCVRLHIRYFWTCYKHCPTLLPEQACKNLLLVGARVLCQVCMSTNLLIHDLNNGLDGVGSILDLVQILPKM